MFLLMSSAARFISGDPAVQSILNGSSHSSVVCFGVFTLSCYKHYVEYEHIKPIEGGLYCRQEGGWVQGEGNLGTNNINLFSP